MNYMRKTNASSSSIGPDKGKVRNIKVLSLKGSCKILAFFKRNCTFSV